MKTLIAFAIPMLFLLCSFDLAAQDYATIDAFAQTVELSKDYKSAALELVAPYEDEVSKARAIFSWLAYNLEYDNRQMKKMTKRKGRGGKVSGKNEAEIKAKLLEREQVAMNRTLKKKKGVCQDFSWLFDAMLFEVGIESEFITGHARTFPSDLGKIPKGIGHAWNAAKINGDWALFDVTWSTNMWEHNSQGYFMMAPEDFVKSHFPEEEQWQLLDEPMDIKTWANQIFWYSGYEGYKIQEVKAGTTAIRKAKFPADSLFTITIALSPAQELYAVKNQGEKSAKLSRKGDHFSIDFKAKRFKGRTTIAIKEGRRFKPLLDLKVR